MKNYYRLVMLLLPLGGLLVVLQFYRPFQVKKQTLSTSATKSTSTEAMDNTRKLNQKSQSTHPPRFDLKLLESSSKEDETVTKAKNDRDSFRKDRERFYAEERRIMAKTWGLSVEKEAEFEITIRELIAENKSSFELFSKGQITWKQLNMHDERAKQRLIEVLGPQRALEYQLTSGQFVKMGLDKKPFVPPTVIQFPEFAKKAEENESNRQPESSKSL